MDGLVLLVPFLCWAEGTEYIREICDLYVFLQKGMEGTWRTRPVNSASVT